MQGKGQPGDIYTEEQLQNNEISESIFEKNSLMSPRAQRGFEVKHKEAPVAAERRQQRFARQPELTQLS